MEKKTDSPKVVTGDDALAQMFPPMDFGAAYDRQGKARELEQMTPIDSLPPDSDLVLRTRASAVKDVVEIEDERLFDERVKAIRAEFGDVDEIVTPAAAPAHKGPSVTWGEWITLLCCLLLVLNMVVMVLIGKVF